MPDDFRDLLVALADAGADFVLVGGFAVAHHGHVRATKDIDVLVRATPENAAKVFRALSSFGAPLQALGITEADFSIEGRVVQLGVPPLRIDLLTSLTGVDYPAATAKGGALDVDGRRIAVIGLEALLRNKRATGRAQDLADVEALEGLARR